LPKFAKENNTNLEWKREKKRKGQCPKKKTSPKSANVQTWATKENNMDMPNMCHKRGKKTT
jgi:hypothetical protein